MATKVEYDGVTLTSPDDIPEAEAVEYIKRGRSLYGRALKCVDVQIDEDAADIAYHTDKVPFERIRRITGYLVGDLGRWNNAKRAEEKDRVKHGAD